MNDEEIGKISQQGRCQMTEGVVGRETGEGVRYTRRKDQRSIVSVKLVSCVSESRVGNRPRWFNAVTERGRGKGPPSGFRCRTG